MKFKRKLALLTSAALIFGSLNVTTAFANEPGDVDGKDGVTEVDGDLIMKYVLNTADASLPADFSVEAANIAPGCEDSDHKDVVTAKDAVLVYYNAQHQTPPGPEDEATVQAYAGKVGGKVFSNYRAVWGPTNNGKPKGHATRQEARDEFAANVLDVSIDKLVDYAKKHMPAEPNISESRKERIESFAGKAYINDLKLFIGPEDEGYNPSDPSANKLWNTDYYINPKVIDYLKAYVVVNDENDSVLNLITTLLGMAGEPFNADNIDDVIKAADGVKTADRDTVIDRIKNGGEAIDANPDLGILKGERMWLRTTFKFAVYDTPNSALTDGEAKTPTALSDYGTNGADLANVGGVGAVLNEKYKGDADYRKGAIPGMTVAKWFQENSSSSDKHSEKQPFADNFAAFVEYAYDLAEVIQKKDSEGNNIGTGREMFDVLGGDRVEITINSGSMPEGFETIAERNGILIDDDDYKTLNEAKTELSPEDQAQLDAIIADYGSIEEFVKNVKYEDIGKIQELKDILAKMKEIESKQAEIEAIYEKFNKAHDAYDKYLNGEGEDGWGDPTSTFFADFRELGYDHGTTSGGGGTEPGGGGTEPGGGGSTTPGGGGTEPGGGGTEPGGGGSTTPGELPVLNEKVVLGPTDLTTIAEAIMVPDEKTGGQKCNGYTSSDPHYSFVGNSGDAKVEESDIRLSPKVGMLFNLGKPAKITVTAWSANSDSSRCPVVIKGKTLDGVKLDEINGKTTSGTKEAEASEFVFQTDEAGYFLVAAVTGAVKVSNITIEFL